MNRRDHRRLLVPLLMLFGLVSLLFVASLSSAPVQADHTAPPTSVTLVGSLQSEAGCPGDWQPDCATTHLSEVGNGIWRGQWNIPTGDWEYKMALNNNWDESYAGNHQANGNTTLTLAEAQTVTFYYDHKTHAVLDSVMDEVATAAGSFQSELGCPGDWQPECVRSLLTDADGDGVYTFVTTAIPAGDYAFKVALDEAWTVSYPAGDVPFTVAAAGDEVTFTWNSATNDVTVQAGAGGEDEALVRPVLEHPIQDDVFYFLMPDRFENSDPNNNVGDDPGGVTNADILRHGYKPDDKGYYHGGDIAGLRSRLEYLDGMGITAIWMAPVFKNRPVQGDGTIAGSSAGYHGYWVTDFTQIDPHFGTNAELTALINEAHALGIKVFFDIILNHTADVIDYEEGSHAYRNKTDFPYRDADGNVFDDRDYAGGDTFPPLDPETSFPYTPIFRTPEDATVKVPAWLNDRTLYHNRGDSSFSGESSNYGDFFGLDDLFTEHPTVVDGMTEIHKFWISEFGIDGFRLDTVKHVNLEFWQQFAPEIMAHAETEGIPDFFIFGEVFDGDPAYMSQYTTDGQLPATLDFGFQGRVSGFAAGSGATNNLRDFFALDDYYTDADSNAYRLPVFIGNHDIGRIGRAVQTQNAGATDAELVDRMEIAHAMMYFARGVPVVYYGDEQGFTGDGNDKDAREDMFPSQVASYNDNDLIGTDATTAVSNFDTSHPIYQALGDYAEVYQAHEALRRGAQIHRYSSDAAGIYAFSRIDRDERREYVVAFNNAETEQEATFPTYAANMQFTAVYPAGAPSATSNGTSDLTITVPPLSFVILRADAALAPSEAAPGIAFNTPSEGDEVFPDDDAFGERRLEVGVDLTTSAFAEVTFAVKVGDATEWTVIGTDNNAPYRVFYDITTLETGTALTFKAIVNDLNGHLNSTTVNAVVGEEQGGGGSCVPHNGYAIIHYQREDGNYDGWGLHLWGDAIDPSEATEWASPKPFNGEDEYGLFAFIKLADGSQPLNFIVHKGDEKDPPNSPDRSFIPNQTPEIWLKQGDVNVYTSEAAARGFVTIHYQRPDDNYDGWGLHLWGDAIDPSEATEWTSPKLPTGFDEYGAYFDIQIQDATLPVNFIVHKGDEKDPPDSPDRSFIPADTAHIWLKSGDVEIYESRADALDLAIIHYHRPAGDYGDYSSTNYNDFWGLHVWEGAASGTEWTSPLKPVRQDRFGQVFEVPLVDEAPQLAYILHRGDNKDLPDDQFLNLNQVGHEVWIVQSTPGYILPTASCEAVAGGDLTKEKAHWLSERLIAWDVEGSEGVQLHHAAEAGLNLTDAAVEGGESIALTFEGELSGTLLARFPHLAGYSVFRIPDTVTEDAIRDILKGQLAVSITQSDLVVDATGVQIPGVLDDLYSYDGELGVTWETPLTQGAGGTVPTLRVWAPTAQSVQLLRFADSTTAISTTHDMVWDEATGVWTVTGDAAWRNQYYLYKVEVYAPTTMQVETNLVTDPYAVSLSMNSTRSQIVDLSDPALMPDGWETYNKPELENPEDISVYELHVRDFSVNDPSVPAELKGKYLAFTLDNSNGMNHLRALAEAGLSHLHLLPTFDIATINENAAERQEPNWEELASYPPNSEEQQRIVGEFREEDAFNWGYDPYHYNVPEGSYATNPDGTTRILEYRQMVQSLNEAGLRVVIDVVYNHTNASGQAERSVLDRVVPGYYHRLNLEGDVETSTCCQNTASEHQMMEKLMIDSVVLWATAYKIDAFRFDLMGHHMKENMLDLQDELHSLIEPKDGVDGSDIYVYGEGWNFGEVANNARGENATQLNMAGTGIGTFSDRLRDAVRGGGPFDNGEALRQNQGFINGLFYDPNTYASAVLTPSQQLSRLLLSTDQIMVGLAGNLAAYTFEDRNGNVVTGAQVDYNGQPAGYTEDPQEHIVYVSKHDNQTLWDNNAYKAPDDATLDERVRMQNLGISISGLSQGVPFFHAGVDMLRSKSLDRDSYDSGDWFNKLDFTYQDNNWGVGLPPAWSNQSNWPIMSPLLANTNIDPEQAHILQSVEHFREILAIRESSELFRLETARQVTESLRFHNTGPDQLPGLIVMSITDDGATDLDAGHERVVVLFNANDEAQTFTEEALTDAPLILHPIQANSADEVVQGATFDAETGTFTVPGRTTAVFVQPEEPTAITTGALGTDGGMGGVGLPLALVGATLAAGLAAAAWRRRKA